MTEAAGGDLLFRLDKICFAHDPGQPVLHDLDLVLHRGERLAIHGANGSGKTSLLMLMVGLLRAHAGSVEAFGRPRQREHDFVEVRRRAGLLFQDADDQLFCPTVIEDVSFGPLNLGRSRGEAHAIAQRVLDALGLAGMETRMTHRLSGGEKRLVSLAGVLAMEPDVLLLDEPTAGLDESASERLMALLLPLRQAMVVVSHDANLRSRLATRTLRLVDGRLFAGSG